MMNKWYSDCPGCCAWWKREEVAFVCIYRQCWFHPLSIRNLVTKKVTDTQSLNTCFTWIDWNILSFDSNFWHVDCS